MAFRPPSLSAIAAFEAAARRLSFTRAAEELNLTHGAVSHAIRGLEQRLGVRLFERHGKGVELTEAGRMFAGRIRLSLGILGDAFDTRAQKAKNRLVISTLPVFATEVLFPRLWDFQTRFPDIEIEIHSSEALVALGDGAVDIGLRYGPGGWDGVSAVKIADEDLFPVMAPSLWDGALSRPEDLLRLNLINHPGFPWGPWFQAAGLDSSEPRSRLATSDSAIALHAATSGMGVILGRSFIVRRALADGRLVRPFGISVRSHYAYWLAWSETSPRIELIGLFRAWMEEQFPRAPDVSTR